MKKIGIIGAMDSEVEALKASMAVEKIVTKASMNFYQGTLNNTEVVIVKSGIGKVNAGICVQILVDVFEVTHIINTGIAGGLHNEINIGDIVISFDAIQHDVDATVFGYLLGHVPGIDTRAFLADSHLITIAKETCEAVNPDIKTYVGRILSGDQFISNPAVKEKLIATFEGYCAEMEGASIAQAAYLNHIPYVVIRAISDKADNSANMDYPQFEQIAAANSARLVENMVDQI
jgi:adenosylhomocysteine nucleosidase